MAAPSVLKVGRTPTGHCIRVEGRGTMRESRSASEFATGSLDAAGTTLVVDVSDCEHLDSTFLGCLVEIQRRVIKQDRTRFGVYAPPEKVKRLFSPTRMDVVLRFVGEPPQVVGELLTLPAADPASPEVMLHVMECHRRLAELGGPQQAAFAAIADNLERELRAKGGGAQP
jgi:anti-anti-sigma regulatory factor